MHDIPLRPQQNIVALALLSVLMALGIAALKPAVGPFIALGFLVVIVAFASVQAALYLLILSMLFSPEIAVGTVQGRGVGGREVSIRMDDILLLVVGFAWFAKSILYREFTLIKHTPVNRPIVYYMLACVLATLLGILIGRVQPKTGFFFVMKYFEYFFVFLMVIGHVTTKDQAVRLIVVLLVTCFLICLYAIAQIPSGQRATAPFEGESGEPNTLGGYLVFIMALIVGLLMHLRHVPAKFLLVVLMVLAVIALGATLSRTSYLAGGVLLLTIGVTQWRKPAVLATVLLIAAMIPVLAPASVKQRVSDTFFGRQYGGEIKVGKNIGIDLSTTQRLQSWQNVVSEWTHYPLLGYGVTGYAWADAQYVKILGETGLAGISAFIFMIYRLWRTAREAILKETDPFCRGIAHGFLLGMIAMLAHGVGANTFILIRIMEPFWLCAGLVMLLPTLEGKAAEEAGEPAAAWRTLAPARMTAAR
jgi:O-antigen ligase